MYITNRNNRLLLSSDPTYAVVQIHAPAYYLNGVSHTLNLTEETGFLQNYSDETNLVTIFIEQKSDTLFYIRRHWVNTSDETVSLQTRFRVETSFTPARYLIPCVNANGTEFGNGGEPKGLSYDGKPWIFSYDRVSIPSCTLTENKEYACSLFASAESDLSLQSSCSISKNEETGHFYQDIYHPVIEAPVTYAYRDKYSPAYETYLTLAPGEAFDCGFYLSVSHPRWENYGICDTLDNALPIFGDNATIGTPDLTKIWDNSITFAKSLITYCKDKKGFIIGFLPDENGQFTTYRQDNCFELAWCGQNILFSRMLIEDYMRNGHKDSLSDALEILDTRVASCTAKSGLLAAQLRDFEDLDHAKADTCNMGYGAYELIRCYSKLKEIGIEKPAYLAAAKGLCDFFCNHFSDEYGFGKLWQLDGTCLDKGGTIGGFVIVPLVKLYELTKEEKYLHLADKALRFYMARDLDQFICTAGALDTCCVDKETSAPFIMSAVMLYELTGNEYYRTCAEKAAYYFTSWMFHYQPIYNADTEISKYGVCVKGMTSVSAQHHHLDMYAGIVVPYLRKLSELTGDKRWQIRSEMMWRAVLQYIGDGDLVIHNVVRPIGSQNEALFHCRWTFTGGKRGDLNDWLVAWPCAFRLSVLADSKTPEHDAAI